jgi:UDP-N-acetylglucosamine 4,6-dehydratase
MTRFWITLEQAGHFVLNALRAMHGGEIFVPKIPSMRITDLATLIGPDCRHEVIGVRPGEKIHEMMVEPEIGHNTLDCRTHFVIQPVLDFWKPSCNGYASMSACPVGFSYTSGTNDRWVRADEMKQMILGLNLADADDLRQAWAREARPAAAAAGSR